MPLQILFWMVYIIAVFFSGWLYYAPGTAWVRPFGGLVVLWVLVGILGYRVFGPAIR